MQCTLGIITIVSFGTLVAVLYIHIVQVIAQSTAEIISGLEKQTSAILEFFFRLLFRVRPYHSNRRAIPHQASKFCPNRATRGGVMTSHTISRWRQRGATLLPVSCLMMSLSSEGQNLYQHQISSIYLNLWLRHNYVRFGKTTVRHIGILLPI